MDKIILLKDVEDNKYNEMFLVKASQFEKAKELIKTAKNIIKENCGDTSLYEEVTGLWSCDNIEYIEISEHAADLVIEY